MTHTLPPWSDCTWKNKFRGVPVEMYPEGHAKCARLVSLQLLDTATVGAEEGMEAVHSLLEMLPSLSLSTESKVTGGGGGGVGAVLGRGACAYPPIVAQSVEVTAVRPAPR